MMTKQIRFDRITGDYSMFYRGQYVGSRATYQEAQKELDRLAHEDLTHKVAA